jgi:hypothetical protein
MEAGRKWAKEWWYTSSHMFIDIPLGKEEEFFRKKMKMIYRNFWTIKEWMAQQYKSNNFGGVIDRTRELLTEFFQTTMDLEKEGKEMLEEFTNMALASVEQAVDTRLAGKIVKFGIQRGIINTDFMVLRAYHMASTKDSNGYIQINTELKWRNTKNMNVVRQSRFIDLYTKAEELKRFWDANKVVDKRAVMQRKTAEVNLFDQKTSLIGSALVERDFETVVINAGQLWEEAKLQKGYEFETGKIQILRYYIEARIRSEENLNSGESLEGWIEMLYSTGGRDFESCWLEIFIGCQHTECRHKH